MANHPVASFKRVKIVIGPTWYGQQYCFHIDPGDGDTLPVYFGAYGREKAAAKVSKLQVGLVDLTVTEEPGASEIKRYLKTIKESNARK